MSTHCGSKLTCRHVFRSLFLSIRPTPCRRKLSTTVLEHVKPTSLIETKPCSNQLLLHEYNQRLTSYAAKFKKYNDAQLEALMTIEEMKNRGVYPNSQSYLQLIMGLSRQRHRTHEQDRRLQHWFDEFFRLESTSAKPMARLKTALISISFRGHPNMKAMFLQVEEMCSMDTECWNAAILGCTKVKNMEDAEELLVLAQQKKMTNSASYHILIAGHLFLQDQPSASRVFSMMLHDKVAADIAIYESFINYYVSLPPSEEYRETLHRLWQAVLITTTDNIPNETILQLLSYYNRNGWLSYSEQVFLDVKSRNQTLDRQCLGEMHRAVLGFTRKRQLPSALSITLDLLVQGHPHSNYVMYRIAQACAEINDKDSACQLMDVIKKLNPNANIAQRCYDALLLDQ